MTHLVQLFLNNAIAQTAEVAATAQKAAPPSWMQFVPFAVIIVVFYFFLIIKNGYYCGICIISIYIKKLSSFLT